MNVKEIIKKYLEENEYDGLYYNDGESCGCYIDELMPCDSVSPNCVPGYRGADPSGEFDDLIYPTKEAAQRANEEAEETRKDNE
jgi:hypothetical protein